MATRTFSGATVQNKTGTASAWASVNPTLPKGGFGIEIDTNKLKVGDGVHAWNSLGYVVADTEGISLPAGSVLPFTGTIDSDGHPISTVTGKSIISWFLCDGNNGTVDLRDKFIIGAGGSYTEGQTGGEATHTLTAAELPGHAHTFSGTSSAVSNDHTHTFNANTGEASANHTHGYSGTVSGDGAHTHTVLGGVSSAELGIGATAENGTFWGTATTSSSSHTHTYSGTTGGVSADHYHGVSGTTSGFSANHTHTYSGTTSSIGSGTAHNNLPPYYALAYIQLTATDATVTVSSTGATTAAGLTITDGSGTSTVFDGSVAKTVDLKALLLLAHPVGSYYWSSISTSPATLFGGTWEQIKDKFILACGDNYAVGATGGEAMHMLTVAEMPNHNHISRNYSKNYNAGTTIPINHSYAYSYDDTSGSWAWNGSGDLSDGEINNTADTSNTGGDSAHNNMPPYQAAYCWVRTA